MAVTVGFEPTVGGYPTQLFESCTFGRSDTSPRTSLRETRPRRESSAGARSPGRSDVSVSLQDPLGRPFRRAPDAALRGDAEALHEPLRHGDPPPRTVCAVFAMHEPDVQLAVVLEPGERRVVRLVI